MVFVGLAIAVGLGFWVYTDAKTLRSRSITVGSMSPAAWGWLTFLVAIVFGILYLIQRPKAIAAASNAGLDAPPPPPPLPPPLSGTVQSAARAPLDARAIARAVDQAPGPRYCTSCGTEATTEARFCANCGHQIDGTESA